MDHHLDLSKLEASHELDIVSSFTDHTLRKITMTV